MDIIKRCPKGDYVTDKDLMYCPRCNTKLLEDGESTQENKERINEDVQQTQFAKI